MANSGEVPLRDVEFAVQAHGVAISRNGSDGSQTTTMVKDGVVVATVLPQMVGRRVLHLLQRKLKIPIHHFYHPIMAPSPPDETVQ